MFKHPTQGALLALSKSWHCQNWHDGRSLCSDDYDDDDDDDNDHDEDGDADADVADDDADVDDDGDDVDVDDDGDDDVDVDDDVAARGSRWRRRNARRTWRTGR